MPALKDHISWNDSDKEKVAWCKRIFFGKKHIDGAKRIENLLLDCEATGMKKLEVQKFITDLSFLNI